MSARGFTLVELLVAMVLTGILGAAAIRLLIVQHQTFDRQGEGLRRTQNARAGFELMTREMRNAGYDPRGVAAAGILRWEPESFGWTADLNADGDIADPGEEILYWVDPDGILMRREAGVDLSVADHVTGLSFGYYAGADDTPASVGEEITQVVVRMTYETPQGVVPGALETRVALRNQLYR